jgi:S1-C subfamily serine protease
MGNALIQFSNGLADAVEQASRSVVAVNARPRTPSSGIVWKPGVVVTTHHTTERDDEITVTLAGGKAAPATLAGRDPQTDLAVLRVENGVAEPAAFGDAGMLRPGHVVLTVGRGPSVSLGAVSSTGGAWRTWRGGQVDRMIQLDVSIYYGFSGGALVDAEGKVVGLNTSALARGAAIAIPANTVSRVVDEILKRGHIARGYLGVGMQPVRFPSGRKLHLESDSGVIILSVESDSPAEKAGLLVGDIIIALDGKPVADTEDIQEVLDPASVGKTIQARLVRGGQLIEVPVVVGERPRGY